MLGALGEALYVGKARDLKKRVGSYFHKPGLEPAHPDDAVAGCQHRGDGEPFRRRGAAAREQPHHQSLAPRYNILFRDDKSYPYLSVTGHESRASDFHRGAKGPAQPLTSARFRTPMRCARAFSSCNACFACAPARTRCSRTARAPACCTRSHRCTAPCTGLISAGQYAEDVANAVLFLEGREDDVIRGLSDKMKAAADAQHYEKAAA